MIKYHAHSSNTAISMLQQQHSGKERWEVGSGLRKGTMDKYRTSETNVFL